MSIDTTAPRTRRAILMGALGATAASVAAAVGRASSVDAANGETVKVGGSYVGSAPTAIDTQSSGYPAFSGTSAVVGLVGNGPIGVNGRSHAGKGIWGTSITGSGVFGDSYRGIGVYATTVYGVGIYAEGRPAIQARGLGDSTGLQGFSGAAVLPVSPSKTGVFGSANQDATSVGVSGKSSAGTGVSGSTSTGVAIRGMGGRGRGGVFSGNLAQLRLQPSSDDSHPEIGVPGDLFVDNASRLWFCQDGSSWVQIA